MYLLAGLGALSKRVFAALFCVVVDLFDVLTGPLRSWLFDHGWMNSYTCPQEWSDMRWGIGWAWRNAELFLSDDPLPENWRKL